MYPMNVLIIKYTVKSINVNGEIVKYGLLNANLIISKNFDSPTKYIPKKFIKEKATPNITVQIRENNSLLIKMSLLLTGSVNIKYPLSE